MAGNGAQGLRIGIDGTCLASGRGYGRFLRELLPPLLADRGAHEYVLFVDEATAREIELPDMPIERLRTGEAQAGAASASGARSPFDLFRMGRGVAEHALDVFYFPSVFSWFPIPKALPIALAIHDTIPERHGAIVFPHAWNRWLWQLKSWAARRQARTLVTVSDYARRQIASHFGVVESEIWVTPEAPSPGFTPVADAGERRKWLVENALDPELGYFIFVGGVNPHKNVEGLVRGLASLAADAAGREAALLLVGSHSTDTFHADTAAIRGEIERLGLGERVHWAGFVPDDALRHLYAGAVAVVLPAFEEGFGLPAVEAAACGAPCVATRESPLPEVLEGGGCFFDPRDESDLARSLDFVWSQPEQRDLLASTALERASALDWAITARETRLALEATANPIRVKAGAA
jgi:glycosyltransferase involved in cell wall biosynthesis